MIDGQVAQGSSNSPSSASGRGPARGSNGALEVRVNGHLVELTPSEFNLLQVLMEQAGYVFTRSDLVNKGLGTEYEGLERTLDSHIRNLRRKIEPDPKNPTYIETVYGVGYRLGGGNS